MKIDKLDEALRILWLKNSDNLNEAESEKEMKHILNSEYSVKMSDEKYQSLFSKITESWETLTFGQLLTNELHKQSLDKVNLTENSGLSLETIEDLLTDSIFTNNVPIMLIRKLLNFLSITFTDCEKAIWKTFEILKKDSYIKEAHIAMQPTFRRSLTSTREASVKYNTAAEGKDLYENEDSLRKYMLRLKSLMES